MKKDNHKDNPDIILLSDTKVMKGEGRAIVMAVGKHTLLSRSRKKEHLEIKEELTDLEQKLDKVSINVGYFAEYAMVACLLTQIIYVVLYILINKENSLTSAYTLMRLLRVGIIAICILIVAIPERLALAVSVAMALSISKMKKDKILIKNVEAV